MGSTSDALADTRGLDFVWIVAIEGFPYLLTNGDPAAAVTAWAGTDWSQALGGMFVEMDRRQAFDPFNPFPEGGRCTLRVVPTPAGGDVLGVQLHRANAGAVTYLKDSLDCDATTINVPVAGPDEFPAAPGELYIGNECIGYAFRATSSFNFCTRGKYSPFPVGSDGFARPHRAGFVSAYNVALEPVVSQHRRMWTGALVGVWIHRVVGGVLDAKVEARLVYSGQIAEYSDDAETGHAVIEVKDILEVGDRTLVRDQFKAKVAEGMWIGASTLTIDFKDYNGSSALDADSLICKVGAVGTNQFEEGYYTVSTLASVINAWLQAEKQAGRIYGDYGLDTPHLGPDGYRTDMVWAMFGGGITPSTTVFWRLTVPKHIAVFLGLAEDLESVTGAYYQWGESDTGAEFHFRFSDFTPMRYFIPAFSPFAEARLKLVQQEGIRWNNYEWLPEFLPSPDYIHAPNGLNQILPVDPAVGDWGIFTIDGKPFIVGALNGDEMRKVRRFFNHDEFIARYVQGTDPPLIEVAQIYAISGKFSDVLLSLFYSTGTGFNHPNYDSFPQSLSLAIPYDLLGVEFDSSIENSPLADRVMTLIIDKPIKLVELIGADLILRGMHLVWSAGLRFRAWDTPIAQDAVAFLSEADKSLPSGQRGSHRTPSAVTSEWLTPILKIMFSRDWTTDTYLDGPLVMEDRGSIDDLGGFAPEKTIKARNMTRADIDAIAPIFLALMPVVSRPASKIRRTIAQSLYEQIVPGDTVLVTDGFARDPQTGERGMSDVPGIVTSIAYSLGGALAANAREHASQVGEVEIMLYPGKRFAHYCPSAKVDDTENSGTFTAGYDDAAKTLRVYAHEFSEAIDPVDASRFVAGDFIEITERDPADPANPLTWERGIDIVSNNDLIIDAVLSSPAFDATKHYYVRSQRYSASAATQHLNVYQADDADARIQDVGTPYVYSASGIGVPFTLEDHTAKAELVPMMSYGDGRARDVAMERSIIRTLNGLMDHKTAHQSPVMWGTATAISPGSPSPAGFRLVMEQDKFVGGIVPNAISKRYMSIAPRFRSIDGSPASVRVTLTSLLPTQNTLDDIPIPQPNVQQTWTTTSTTWQDGTPYEFDLRVLSAPPLAVILIEITGKAETRGLSQCIETERRA